VAALSVVGFHYTSRYDAAVVHVQPLPLGLPFGHLGVELFFIISGFVILMTVDRARSASDFVFARASRLFPTYWVAVLLTAFTLRAVQMPGYQRSLSDIAANLTMVQGYFGIASIDGAYWSLGVELLFYAWMLLLWRAGALRRPAVPIAAVCAISLAASLSALAGLRWPSALQTLLMAEWGPWFALGTALYSHHSRGMSGRLALGLVALAVLAIAVRGPLVHAGVAVGAGLLVHGAAGGRLPLLASRPLVALGRVSYPLYLLHQALGWWVIVSLQQAGLGPALSIAIAIALSVAAGFLMHHAVEAPAMAALRAWRSRRQDARGRQGDDAAARGADPAWIAGCALVIVALSGGATLAHALRDRTPLPHETIRSLDPARDVPIACEDGAPATVILVLGQSNAASHAAPIPPVGAPSMRVFAEGRCVLAADPLPGTTGGGSSLWSAVQEDWSAADPQLRLLWAPLAVGATAIARWTGPDPVHERLVAHLQSLRAAGLRVDRVVWQQGESDARDGTDAGDYLRALHALRALLDAHGVSAPMHVARSTFCRSAGTGAIGRALERHAASLAAARILPGPDTDALRDATDRRRRLPLHRCRPAPGRAALARGARRAAARSAGRPIPLGRGRPRSDRRRPAGAPGRGNPPQPSVTTIFPKCRLAAIAANASPSAAKGYTSDTGSASVPSATAGSRSAHMRRDSSRTSSTLRVRKVTPRYSIRLSACRSKSIVPVMPARRPTLTIRPRIAAAARLPATVGPASWSTISSTPFPPVASRTRSGQPGSEVSIA
jgi:peptidoglycan/LPS O-acetylase OafA/YrhL